MPISPELEAIVLHELASGRLIKNIQQDWVISPSVWSHHFTGPRTGPERAEAYARARDAQSDSLADDVVIIADTEPDPHRARNRIEARKWLAGCTRPHKYGNRIDLNVTDRISISAALEEADSRLWLRSMRDQHNIIDATPIASTPLLEHGPTDKQSVDAEIERILGTHT